MASVTELITDFRLDCAGVSTSQISDAQALSFLNKSYRTIINRIKSKIREGYFYDEWTTNAVENQSEYTLPKRGDLDGEGNPISGCTKLISVSVKYSTTETNYTQLRPDTINNLNKDLNWYELNTPNTEGNAFFIVNGNSYFIYPSFTKNVTGGIILYGISDPIDLLSGGAESTIKIPLEYHDVLLKGMKYWYYSSRGVDYVSIKNDAKGEFFADLANMINELSNRVQKPMESEMPYLGHLG